MGKDRIQIDGEWYVKESTITSTSTNTLTPLIEIDENAPTFFRGCVFEDDTFCFEATNLTDKDGDIYGGLEIEVTNKNEPDWQNKPKEYIDNEAFLIGLLDNDKEATHEILKFLDVSQAHYLTAFVKFLRDRGWFSS